MGLLDQLLGGGQNAGGAQVHQGLLDHVLGMIGNTQSGGLGGLVDKLKAGGLGSAVDSWVGTGPNQPVNGNQVASALGTDQISQLAQKFGLSTSQVSSHLAQILPEVINHLTPNGQVPDHGVVQSALGMLRGKLFGA